MFLPLIPEGNILIFYFFILKPKVKKPDRCIEVNSGKAELSTSKNGPDRNNSTYRISHILIS